MGIFKIDENKGLGRGKNLLKSPIPFDSNPRNHPRTAGSFRGRCFYLEQLTQQLSFIRESKQELNMVYLPIIKGLKVRRLECLTDPLSTLFEAND